MMMGNPRRLLRLLQNNFFNCFLNLIGAREQAHHRVYVTRAFLTFRYSNGFLVHFPYTSTIHFFRQFTHHTEFISFHSSRAHFL